MSSEIENKKRGIAQEVVPWFCETKNKIKSYTGRNILRNR
jgi:hypothetical protein